jgi:hypothetical protein
MYAAWDEATEDAKVSRRERDAARADLAVLRLRCLTAESSYQEMQVRYAGVEAERDAYRLALTRVAASELEDHG